VGGTLGYEKAEVTAGGVALDEVDASTLESRKARGVYLCGEILDVDGRLGGFNFQWAWSSGTVAGRGAGARHLDHLPPELRRVAGARLASPSSCHRGTSSRKR